MSKIIKSRRGWGGTLSFLLAGFAISAAIPGIADTHRWLGGKNGNFSTASNWRIKDGATGVAPSSGDDIEFWFDSDTAQNWLYVTNDLTSFSFGNVCFSGCKVDIVGNLTTGSSKQIQVATSPSSPLAVVNKRSGNWTLGHDLFIGGNNSSHSGVTGIVTNNAGNITVSSNWIYIGGNATAADLPRVNGSLVINSGTVTTKMMVLGGKANNTSGLLDVKGGNVTITSWAKFSGEWCGVLMAGWGGARGEIRIAKGAVMALTASGANIGMGEGTNVITIDGTLRLPSNGNLFRIDKGTASTGGIQITIGKDGRLECQSVTLYNDGGSGPRKLTLDGGTFAPSGNANNPLANLTLAISQKNGMLEVPSGKTIHTSVWVMDATATSKGRVVKTGAGTLDINNWFRPSGGLRVNAGTVQMTHTASANFDSFNYPLSISKTGTVTGGAFVMGRGGSLEFEFASKTSGATMNITTSFTRNANIPITFSTESAFGFDDTYTLVKGGKITNTNNFSVASATANGVDITSSVYLATQSGNLVLKRKPYFTIKVR